MDLFTRADLNTLLVQPRTPCVSVFMPTHRASSQEDPIRWRVHIEQAEKNLIVTGLRASEVKELLAPAQHLLENVSFWKHQCDGLAFFRAPEFMRLYRLPLAFEDLVVVADRFQVTPLLPLLISSGRFFVLALSQNAVRLLEGSRYSVSEVDLKGVPRSLAEALLAHDSDEPLTFHSRPTSGGGWAPIFGGHGVGGHGVGIDDKKEELLRYFQRIDRGLHPLLRDEKAPLVLAAVDYLRPIYRQANTYPQLVEQAVEGNPDRLSNAELHDRAWALVQPHFERAQKQAVAQYRQLAGTGRTAHEVREVVPAACEGRIETLFVALGRQRWGKFDPVGGRLEEHEQEKPGDSDLLNLAATHTLGHGRSVYAVEPEKMPDTGLLAAVYCLPLAKRGR
jgi:hypothetical protein